MADSDSGEAFTFGSFTLEETIELKKNYDGLQVRGRCLAYPCFYVFIFASHRELAGPAEWRVALLSMAAPPYSQARPVRSGGLIAVQLVGSDTACRSVGVMADGLDLRGAAVYYVWRNDDDRDFTAVRRTFPDKWH